MECQGIKKAPGSSIVNNANLWATQMMGNAKCHLELFLRVINVSVETMKIVAASPKLDLVWSAISLVT